MPMDETPEQRKTRLARQDRAWAEMAKHVGYSKPAMSLIGFLAGMLVGASGMAAWIGHLPF
jgi:hypothetical protein